MDIQYTPSSLYSHLKNHINSRKIPSSRATCFQPNITRCCKSRITCINVYAYCHPQGGGEGSSYSSAKKPKRKKCIVQLKEEPLKVAKKKGTIAGAVALIIGTSVGSGILALPRKTSPAGLLPSTISITICWAFLLIEALLLVEINVGLLKRKKEGIEENELEAISIRTMAQETLGEWGGSLVTVTYVFLGYASMIAYSSKSGTRTTDQVNQWLTASMIGLLVVIEAVVIVVGGWSGFEGSSDWTKVPATVPVMIFALVYHDIAPVLCAYLEGDLRRIRASVLLGSVVPLLTLLVWNAIALGLSAQAEQFTDPFELLMRVRWGGVSVMVEAFSLLALGTSIIGTLLSFSQFYNEQLNILSTNSPSKKIIKEPSKLFGLNNWWGRNKVNVIATTMVVAPTLLVSTTVPDAFSAATDIAGGYCMTMLYGVLPPAMALAMYHGNGNDKEQTMELSRARPALLGVGLFACAIVVEQILQDLSNLQQ